MKTARTEGAKECLCTRVAWKQLQALCSIISASALGGGNLALESCVFNLFEEVVKSVKLSNIGPT